MHDDKGWQGRRVISGAHGVTSAPRAAPFKKGLRVAVKGSQIRALYKANKYVKNQVCRPKHRKTVAKAGRQEGSGRPGVSP